MQTYLKSRPVFVQLMLFLGLAFGIYIVLNFIGVPILQSITGLSVIQFSQDNLSSNTMQLEERKLFLRGMILIQFLGLFVIPSLLFAYFSDPAPRDYLRLRRSFSPGYWGIAVIILFAALPIVEWLGLLNRNIDFGSAQQFLQELEESQNRQIALLLGQQTGMEVAVNIIFVGLFAAIGEELFFRGILQRMFIRGTGAPWAGILITALVFSAFHLQFMGFLPRLVLGVLLGALYWYSGSLWTSIIAHFLYNASQVVLVYFNPRMLTETETTLVGSETLLPAALFSLLLTGLLLYLLIRRSPASYEAVYRNDFEEAA